MLKKLAVCLGLSLSINAFAGGMGCPDGGCNDVGDWDFGFEALYLKPQYNGMFSYIGFYSYQPSVNSTYITEYLEYDQKWHFGFIVEGSYHMTAADDYNLNWAHYKSTSGTTWFDDNALNTPLTPPSNFVSFGNLTTNWDQVNIERAHRFYNSDYSIRVHGGLSFSQVKTLEQAEYYYNVAPAGFTYSYREFKYSGLGPRLGVDGHYNFTDNFYLLAKGATTLLIGNRDFDFSSRFPAAPTGPRNNQGTSSQKALIPELEGAIGLGVSMDTGYGRYTLEAIYRGLIYWSVAERPFVSPSRNTPSANSDLMLYGAGLKLHWQGDFA